MDKTLEALQCAAKVLSLCKDSKNESEAFRLVVFTAARFGYRTEFSSLDGTLTVSTWEEAWHR